MAGTNPLFARDDVKCRAEIVGERHGGTLSRHCGDRLERPGSDGNSSRLSVLRRPLWKAEFFDHASGYLCWVMDAGFRDLDYFLRDHFR